jgi:TonB family protein
MSDYPVYAFQRRQEGATAFELLVDPRGKPVNCIVTQSSGSDALDRQACNVAMRKAHFAAAIDANGAPVYGTYRTKVTWALDPEHWAQMEAGPDLEVNLSQLPEGTVQPVDVKFAYLVDASGRASNCTPMGPVHSKLLDPLGCQLLTSKAQRPPSAAKAAHADVGQTSWIRFSPTQ